MIWRWLLFGTHKKSWMPMVMVFLWTSLGVWGYLHPTMPYRVQWLIFDAWACGFQLAKLIYWGRFFA